MNGLRRPQRVRSRSLFQATSGATRKLKAMLTLPSSEMSAGSAMNLRIVKISAVPLHFSTKANTPTGRLIQRTQAQGIRAVRVRIMAGL